LPDVVKDAAGAADSPVALDSGPDNTTHDVSTVPDAGVDKAPDAAADRTPDSKSDASADAKADAKPDVEVPADGSADTVVLPPCAAATAGSFNGYIRVGETETVGSGFKLTYVGQIVPDGGTKATGVVLRIGCGTADEKEYTVPRGVPFVLRYSGWTLTATPWQTSSLSVYVDASSVKTQ
jgi:hypothetical protein